MSIYYVSVTSHPQMHYSPSFFLGDCPKSSVSNKITITGDLHRILSEQQYNGMLTHPVHVFTESGGMTDAITVFGQVTKIA